LHDVSSTCRCYNDANDENISVISPVGLHPVGWKLKWGLSNLVSFKLKRDLLFHRSKYLCVRGVMMCKFFLVRVAAT